MNETATYLTTKEAAAYLRLTMACLAKWRVSGEGPPFIKVGRRVLYAREDLDRWLMARKIRSTSQAQLAAQRPAALRP